MRTEFDPARLPLMERLHLTADGVGAHRSVRYNSYMQGCPCGHYRDAARALTATCRVTLGVQ